MAEKNQKYIAMLRGIGPGNPNMRNAKLKEAFELAGLKNVASIISSGNIVFESADASNKLEEIIEKSLSTNLGLSSKAIVRSKEQIDALLSLKPFSDLNHSKETYLLVTFLKDEIKKPKISIPYKDETGTFEVIGFESAAQCLFSVTNTTKAKTPDVMRWLEKQLGKDITSRTWNTVEKIAKKFTS